MKTNQKDIQKLENHTFISNIVISVEDIKKEHQTTLKSIQAEFETKGFRKGKAPLDVVEQNISANKLIEEIAGRLLSKTYEKIVKENDLKPIIQPQVRIKNPPVTLDKEWQVEITGCELPEIKINEKFFEEVKTKEKKIDQIIETLVKNSQTTLPPILLDADIENRLSQLVDQATQAGITVAQYLKNRNQTLEQYKESLKDQVTKEWTLNLAINKIAIDQKITISPKEVEEITAKNPALRSNLNLVYHFLTQQKVLEYLQNLK